MLLELGRKTGYTTKMVNKIVEIIKEDTFSNSYPILVICRTYANCDRVRKLIADKLYENNLACKMDKSRNTLNINDTKIIFKSIMDKYGFHLNGFHLEGIDINNIFIDNDCESQLMFYYRNAMIINDYIREEQ